MRASIEKAPLWVRTLEGKLRQRARRGLVSAAHRLVGVIQNEIIPSEPRVPVDRGLYRAGWRVVPEEDSVWVRNDTPHALFIEEGVRGDNVKVGRAMIDALQEWVIRKGLVGKGAPSRNSRGQFSAAQRDQTARRVAWAIAQSMRKNGIFAAGKGLHILKRARAQLPRLIDEEVRREIRRARQESKP